MRCVSRARGGKLTKKQRARFLWNPLFGAVGLAVDAIKRKVQINKIKKEVVKAYGKDNVYKAIKAAVGTWN